MEKKIPNGIKARTRDRLMEKIAETEDVGLQIELTKRLCATTGVSNPSVNEVRNLLESVKIEQSIRNGIFVNEAVLELARKERLWESLDEVFGSDEGARKIGETALVFDIELPACNLGAMELRNQMFESISDLRQHIQIRNDTGVVTEASVFAETKIAESYRGMELGFVTFIQEPADSERTGFLSKVLRSKKNGLVSEPLSVGLSLKGRFTKKRYVYPVVQSVITDDGCAFFMPDGTKLDSDTYNIDELVSSISAIREVERGVSPDIPNHKIERMAKAVEYIGVDEIFGINQESIQNSFTDMLLRQVRYNTRKNEFNFGYKSKRLEIGRLTQQLPSEKEIDLHFAATIVDDASGEHGVVIDISAKLDSRVYGDNASTRREIKRYRLEFGDFGEDRAYVYGSDGITTSEIDDAQLAELTSLKDVLSTTISTTSY